MRRVAVEGREGRGAREARRGVVVHAHPLAQQAALTSGNAQSDEAERVTAPIGRVEARRLAWAADAEAALADSEGHGQGRRGRRPRPWRSHALRSRGEPCQHRKKRTRSGRPPKAEQPHEEGDARVGVECTALERAKDAQGGGVLAPTVGAEGGADPEGLQADQAPNTTGDPGLRWLNNPAALTPGWLEKPERLAT
jgi:hypothetical protein